MGQTPRETVTHRSPITTVASSAYSTCGTRPAAAKTAAVCGAWLVFLLGLLLAPAGWAVWCAFGGAAQGGGITVIFALIVRKARDAAENRRMSALVQGGGYTVAATGPFVLGVVHEASGEWTAPLAVVIGSILVLTVAGLLSSRERATRPG